MVTSRAKGWSSLQKICTCFGASTFRSQSDEQLDVPVREVFMDSLAAVRSTAAPLERAHERVVSHAARPSAREVDFRYFH